MKKLTVSICCLVIGIGLAAFKPNKKQIFKISKEVKENFAYIPNGDVYVKRISTKMDAFFISKYEVTNAQYREFLNDLAKNGKTADLKVAKVDSVKWYSLDFFTPEKSYSTFIKSSEREKLTENAKNVINGVYEVDTTHSIEKSWYKPMVVNYNNHAAYNDFPVVNITYEAALLYCNWLTEKLNKNSDNELKYVVHYPAGKNG